MVWKIKQEPISYHPTSATLIQDICDGFLHESGRVGSGVGVRDGVEITNSEAIVFRYGLVLGH